jgi:lipopolysaccharide transport system ATP-binding protein
MSSDRAIMVENLSKCYQIYDKPRDRLFQMLFRGHRQYYREFWALKDVSLDIKKGETIGIIGRNGSGKSTLLQLICGTLNPTSGNIRTHGRIAALLELGTGFNLEFTGRENVYMNASVLGLSNEEINKRFDSISSFADIGEFLEQPVKTYSSGMVVRLAFSIAINVDPEILVVDEALSVGDEQFQRKCFSRIEAISASGATILFVSHSGGTIIDLCDRAVLFDAGEKLATGLPKQIVGRYQKLIYAPGDKQESIRAQIQREDENSLIHVGVKKDIKEKDQNQNEKSDEWFERYDQNLKPTSTIKYEARGAHIDLPAVLTLSGKQVNNVISGKTYRFTYTVNFTKTVCNVRFGMLIKTISGVELGGGVSAPTQREAISVVSAGSEYQVEFRFRCSLNTGVYFLNAGVVGDVNGSETYLHRLIDIAMFRVHRVKDSAATAFVDFCCFSEIELL